MDAMHLTEKERETLEYYMSGWKRSEVAKLLALSLNGMDYRKLRIRYKYNTYIGNSNILRLSLFAVYWAVRPKKFAALRELCNTEMTALTLFAESHLPVLRFPLCNNCVMYCCKMRGVSSSNRTLRFYPVYVNSR